MRAIVIFLALTIPTALSVAQQPAAEPAKTYASAADVMALLAKAKAEHKEGQAVVTEHILHLAPYDVHLEYRPQVGGASVHEKEAEVFYVIDGSGTMVMGGKLINEKRSNPENSEGPASRVALRTLWQKGTF